MADIEPELVIVRAEAVCRRRGARLTEQRKTVLRLLCSAERPVSAYELLERMRGLVRNPAPPTVYRALDFLQQQGLVHKIESLHAYIGCTHPGHPHSGQFLICAECGVVAELEDAGVNDSLEAAGKALGFRTERPVVELLGICARCQAKKSG